MKIAPGNIFNITGNKHPSEYWLETTLIAWSNRTHNRYLKQTTRYWHCQSTNSLSFIKKQLTPYKEHQFWFRKTLQAPNEYTVNVSPGELSCELFLYIDSIWPLPPITFCSIHILKTVVWNFFLKNCFSQLWTRLVQGPLPVFKLTLSDY